MGYLNVKDKDGKTAVTLPVQIDNIDKNYTASDYSQSKIWNFDSESEKSLNPFIDKEKKVYTDGLNNYTLEFTIQKMTFTDGKVLELQDTL